MDNLPILWIHVTMIQRKVKHSKNVKTEDFHEYISMSTEFSEEKSDSISINWSSLCLFTKYIYIYMYISYEQFQCSSGSCLMLQQPSVTYASRCSVLCISRLYIKQPFSGDTTLSLSFPRESVILNLYVLNMCYILAQDGINGPAQHFLSICRLLCCQVQFFINLNSFL